MTSQETSRAPLAKDQAISGVVANTYGLNIQASLHFALHTAHLHTCTLTTPVPFISLLATKA
jgi:hypothetical protein